MTTQELRDLAKWLEEQASIDASDDMPNDAEKHSAAARVVAAMAKLDGVAGPTWEVVEACERHFERIQILAKTADDAYLRYGAESRASAGIHLISLAKAGDI